MDKKSIIGILIAVVGLVAYQIHWTKQQRAYNEWQQLQKAVAEAKAAEEAKNNPQPTVAAGTPAAPTSTTPAAPPVEVPVEEQVEKISTKSVEYVFTNLGGGIQRAKLFD